VIDGHTFDFKDSVRTFHPDSDVTIRGTGGASFAIDMKFTNNACAHFTSVCPSINATVNFSPDASYPGGWHVTFDRDGYPSMGVYKRNAADTGFDTVKEDPQKVHNGVLGMLALAGAIRSSGANAPAPANPLGCYVQ